ncbi:stage III sporulation protein AF [Paenibacillus mesophilus]|uniref:stage III sporulation protein AF n=1 Tax=Paenibacillus mesophilus TaxID=2582849 RepID=UPI00110E3F32|nr:stage III sporulation protein AF [Paenibacillus mesophilus]TMV51406.1 stage III sporulation protein AF [Paenibacillus mesophilus]
MIHWMSGWLKEIVLIVLLAAFVDLLLPNNAFQRYVRTVLGLFILLTLLSPILSLFQQKWDAQKMLASVEQVSSRTDIGASFGSMRPLQAIMQDAERIRQNDRAEAQRIMERQLAAELAQSVGTEANVRIKQVKLQMSYDNNGTPSMKHMQVILDHIEAAPAAAKPQGGAAGRRPIGAVEPVHIDIRVGAAEAKPDESKLTNEQVSTKQRIFELLNKQWQLNRDQITVLYETELGKER